MRIVDILKMEYIIGDLASATKSEVLKEILCGVSRQDVGVDAESMSKVLLARESLGSTGIGDGIAIPHGKVKGLLAPVITFGRSHAGIPFESLDGKPAYLFFAILVPDSTTGIHLKLLARLSRMLKDKDFRGKLLKAKTVEEIYSAIDHQDRSSPR